jgi:Na+/proline symporter/signal transduction histidine kinase
MNGWWIALVLVGYLAMLFFVAHRIDNNTRLRLRIQKSPTVYALSLAVYCTAWTFFGSVGAASRYSLEFLAVYIGPIIVSPFLWLIYRKFIRISKAQGISSIADFISNRYNKSIALNRLVTILLFVGIVPYIALQITGIERGVATMLSWDSVGKPSLFNHVDIAFIITIGLGLFIILFTTRRFQNKEQNTGLVGAVALESIVKLTVFLLFGLYIVYAVFKNEGDLLRSIPQGQLKVNATNDFGQWSGMILLSMMAFLFLPRQFEMGVVEINQERQLKRATWLFPLYLILINIFVIPIAIAGNKLFAGTSINADTYMLAIPLALKNYGMALLVLLGGFSAASGMIIVSTHALSKMVSNSLLMPAFINSNLILNRFKDRNHIIPVFFRRLSIFIVLVAAYFYYRFVVSDFSLISIGLISFVAVAQFAPTILGGVYWKMGNQKGAFAGIVVGFAIWFSLLVIPSIVSSDVQHVFQFFHIDDKVRDEGSLITMVLFWSLSLNLLTYVLVSVFTKQSALERSQALVYVDVFKYSEQIESTVVWRGKAFFPDVKSLLVRFLGEHRVSSQLNLFAKQQEIELNETTELDPRIVNHAEKLLSGVVGAASAKILVASVVKEEKLSMQDVVGILEESQKLILVNKQLQQKTDELKRVSEALKQANNRLKENDLLKDEFLYTVTHEMRTPLTSIKALSEILEEDDEIPIDTKKEFQLTILKETNRMTRLISQVLDLENFESGKHQLVLDTVQIEELIMHCIQTLDGVFKQENIKVCLDIEASLPVILADHDRITQVILNLLANAAKFRDKENGVVWVSAHQQRGFLVVEIADNGLGVKEELQEIIFEKFFQAKNQTIRKPKGSGLGLAISKKIIQLHEGKIGVTANIPTGARFTFTLPINKNSSTYE